MNSKTLYRYGAPPLLALGLTAPALLGGCGDDALTCEADIVARVHAFQGAVTALAEVSGQMKGAVAFACSQIATDLGGDPPDVGASAEAAASVSDDDLETACNVASAQLDIAVSAAGSVSIEVVGGKCEVAASAQISCEAECDVSGGCDPGSIDVRCEGSLSGECSAECSGSCEVEGGSVECAGGCSGTCEGTCDGECSSGSGSECSGTCTGTCTGSCTGTCEVVAPSASCSGTCTGSCSVDFVAPSCVGEVTPPSCDIDAECQAGCDAQGTLKAECTPPEVLVVVEGDADLEATLTAHLPALFLVFQVQGELVVDAAADVAGKAIGVAEAAVSVPACVAEFGADLVASFTGAVSASASVSVSVSASASASGSATGG